MLMKLTLDWSVIDFFWSDVVKKNFTVRRSNFFISCFVGNKSKRKFLEKWPILNIEDTNASSKLRLFVREMFKKIISF